MKLKIVAIIICAITSSCVYLDSEASTQEATSAQPRTERILEEAQEKAAQAEQQLAKMREKILEFQAKAERQAKEQRQQLLQVPQRTAGTPVGSLYGNSVRRGFSRPVHLSDKIRIGVDKLKAADNDEAKADAKAQLSELLVEHFDEDMKNREAELKKVQKRVEKLKAQLNKRLVAKESIIKLQLQVLENEAAGLGFFSNPVAKAPSRSSGRNSDFGEPLLPPTRSNVLLPTSQPPVPATTDFFPIQPRDADAPRDPRPTPRR